jgi:arylsulfatase A-like enzyme
MTSLTRRDFLKVAGPLLAGAYAARQVSSSGIAPQDDRKNIIVILCDAFSAGHLSLYGYARPTTPNLDAFAQYSTVFHNHYSGGNFTTTSTACMLTGMNAWKHRAINYAGLVKPEYVSINPYSLLKPDYHTLCFSQNVWPSNLVGQYIEAVDRFLPPTAYSLLDDDPLLGLFKTDQTMASIALEGFMLSDQGGALAGSPLLGYANKSSLLNYNSRLHNARYPDGFPEIMPIGHLIPYLNEDVYDGIYKELAGLHSKDRPYFAYFHLWSPHFPYRPRQSYARMFNQDGYAPAPKPSHPLMGGLSEDYLLSQRNWYDRQVAQVDEEFGRLLAELDRNGILDNSYLIFTADHGELFERGFIGHGFQMMYEDVLRIPLIIRSPGQTEREDVFAATSNTDLLPTILSISGKDIPSEIDGRVLPGLGGTTDTERPILSMVATENSAFGPVKKAVLSMRKGAYKIIHYLGYESAGLDSELYDLENDPHELEDLAAVNTGILTALRDELLSYLSDANRQITGSHDG